LLLLFPWNKEVMVIIIPFQVDFSCYIKDWLDVLK